MAPSMAPTVLTSDSAQNEMRDIQSGFDRMENKALTSQRVVLSEEQSARMNKLALGAKLERALDRRMSSQDAVMRRPAASAAKRENGEKEALNEKRAL